MERRFSVSAPEVGGAAPERLRVGFLIDRWQPARGGAEGALALFAAHLSARGHDVLAFARRGPRPGEAAPARFVPVQAGGWTRGARERHLGEALLAAAAARGCELTVGVRHLPRVDLYWPHGGAHAETLAALGKAPRGRHRAFLALERALLAEGGARAVACVSALVREELARRYPACAERLVLVPNGVDLDRFHPRERAAARARLLAATFGAEGGPLLAFVGRNPRLKGLEELLRALAGLPDRPWRLVVAGPPHPEPWRRRARRLGLDPARVRAARELPALDLAAGADLLVLPTHRDPCPLAVLEALACGTPVVTTARAGSADALAGEEAGEVLPRPGEVGALREALARRLARLAAGPPDRAAVRAGVAGRGLAGWMARLEELALAAARPRRS